VTSIEKNSGLVVFLKVKLLINNRTEARTHVFKFLTQGSLQYTLVSPTGTCLLLLLNLNVISKSQVSLKRTGQRLHDHSFLARNKAAFGPLDSIMPLTYFQSEEIFLPLSACCAHSPLLKRQNF
jgi:hypothetical protein